MVGSKVKAYTTVATTKSTQPVMMFNLLYDIAILSTMAKIQEKAAIAAFSFEGIEVFFD
jgi:hypothetical protein